MAIRPMLFNPAASYDLGYDHAAQLDEQGFVEADNRYQFTLDTATADRGYDDYMESTK